MSLPITETPTIPRPHSEKMYENNIFYVASCVPDGGIYRCELTEGGAVTEKVIAAPSPMWLERSGYDSFWVLLRAPFSDSAHSGVAEYIHTSGERLGDILSTQGEVACHLSVAAGKLYAANYVSGSVWCSNGGLVIHEGRGIDPERQIGPHVHCVFPSPDKKYILSCDLGMDKIFVYDTSMRLVSTADTPAGSGARHLVFSKDGKTVYAISEMGGAIHTCKWDDGILTHISDYSLLPEGVNRGKGAAIRLSPDGKLIYATERATKSIVILRIDGASLAVVDRVSCQGDEPRDLLLAVNGEYAVCANQFSDSCSVYKVESNGGLTYIGSFNIPAPIAVSL